MACNMHSTCTTCHAQHVHVHVHVPYHACFALLQATGRGMIARKKTSRMLWRRTGSVSRLSASIKALQVQGLPSTPASVTRDAATNDVEDKVEQV